MMNSGMRRLVFGGSSAPEDSMPVAAKLSRKLQETLGDEVADAMVDWMHRVENSRTELRELQELGMSRVEAQFGEFYARMEAGFRDVDARFAEFDARMAGRFRDVDARFAEFDARMEARFRDVDARFAEFDARMEARFRDVDARFVALESKMDSRFVELEAMLRRELQAESSELRQAITSLEARLERRFGDLMKWSFVYWTGSTITFASIMIVLSRGAR